MTSDNSTRELSRAKPKKSGADALKPGAPDNKPILLDFTTYDVDVVEALEYLLHEARRGQVIGLAYGALLRKRTCIVDAVGELDQNPLYALGVVTLLQAEITKRATD